MAQNNNHLDPDINFLNNFTNTSPLYLPEDVNKLNIDKSFSILHINCRSLYNKTNEIALLLDSTNTTYSIIGFTETWLNATTAPLINFPNYSFVFNNRNQRIGGGVGILIHNSFEFIIHPDFFPHDNNLFECLCIEICFNKLPNIIIIVLYRPPNTDVNLFLNSFTKLLNELPDDKPIYIMGDFNINLLKNDRLNVNINFSNLLYSHNFHPNILIPTRTTEFSATLIDNIFCNHLIDHISGVLNTDISDHFPIFTTFEFPSPTPKHNLDHTLKLRHNFSSANILRLKNFLHDFNWESIINSQDVNEGFLNFNDILQEAISNFCPIISRTSSKIKRPWITQGLYISLKTKNKLYKKYLANPTPMNKFTYVKFKNKFVHLTKLAEKEYYVNNFIKSKNNPRNTWSLIKSLFNQNIKLPDIILKQDANIMTDKSLICHEFNKFFNSIYLLPSNLNTTNKHAHHMGSPVVNSLFLLEANYTEIINLVKSFKNSKSSGLDNVSNFLLKKIITSIITPLHHLINLSLDKGIFPNIYKTSKILPIFKSGCPHNINNYRPISLLSSISKLLEKIIHVRLTSFLEKNNILCNSQYGFRKSSSTELAIFDLYHYVAESIEHKSTALGIFIDLSKAFDRIDHKLLLAKLQYYGVRGTAYNWFYSYLVDRKHLVSISTESSSPLTMAGGVPQGSILGPLLFNIFLNDINMVSPLLKLILYADDTTLLMRDTNPDSLLQNANIEVNKIAEWFSDNNLTINYEKTCFIVFGPKIVTNKITCSLNISTKSIARVEDTKFLGVYITSNLNWIKHITFISNKIAKNLGIISKLRKKMPANTILLLYYTLIYPYLNYCITIWGNSPKTHLSILIKSQNRFLRILLRLKKNDHISNFFSTSNVLHLRNIYKLRLLMLFYKLLIKTISTYFGFLLSSFLSIKTHATRSCDIFFLPKCRTTIYRNSPFYQGMLSWNSVPTTIMSSGSIHQFRHHIFKLIKIDYFDNF